ncbi:MAG: PPOX class F420-dependent oxidoreductase [Ilumatobacteraceae bacterium]|nr:PPOX class F420-dependent oxidoreductase [Ilumatobacteraceae bacterium]
MELSDALDYVRQRRQGVIVTIKADGRPQLSNIVYGVDDDGTIRISATAGRAKTNNLQRDPRASLHVTDENFGTYCVIEGDVEVTQVTTEPGDATSDTLVEYYRTLAGEHPDWDEYRRAMIDEGRLMLLLRPTRAYGMLSR